MKKDNMAPGRERLEQMSTAQLDALLKEELGKDPPDGDAVRLILAILKEREKSCHAPCSPETEAAWQTYQSRRSGNSPSSARKHSWFLKVASVVLIFGVLIVVSGTAQATGLFDRIARWTDDVFELLSFPARADSDGYTFETDHPGLQQVYDAAAKLGITGPAVPMWLPDTYKLIQCDVTEGKYKSFLVAEFSDGESRFVFEVNLYTAPQSRYYLKDKSQVSTYENSGITHYILQNEAWWTAVWANDNTECLITSDCPEDTLYEILRSIYSLEA